MVGELCAVLLQAFYLTLDSTTVIGVFLSMWYFTYFMCNPIASSLCDTKHPPYIKILLKNEVRGLYTLFYILLYTIYTFSSYYYSFILHSYFIDCT